jgi:hypothetical protein
MATHDTEAVVVRPGEKPSLMRLLRTQRKALLLAALMIVASFWILGQLDRWVLAGCISVGVLLGLANHLMTERWLFKVISSGKQLTRRQIGVATVIRLAVLSVVAVGVAVAFWPDGVGLLLGLAIFRLIALVMTGLPLLKELKNP